MAKEEKAAETDKSKGKEPVNNDSTSLNADGKGKGKEVNGKDAKDGAELAPGMWTG